MTMVFASDRWWPR